MAAERRLFWLPPAVAIGYGLVYLYAIGDLSFAPPPAWDWRVASPSLERLLSARAPFRFEALAIAEAGYAVLLVSPLNLLVAALLAGLLAVNIHGALYLRAYPACRTGHGGLIAGATPALLAGGACCAPALVLLLGIPALGAFSAFFGWLVPLSIAVLGLNRARQRRQGAPAMGR